MWKGLNAADHTSQDTARLLELTTEVQESTAQVERFPYLVGGAALAECRAKYLCIRLHKQANGEGSKNSQCLIPNITAAY